MSRLPTHTEIPDLYKTGSYWEILGINSNDFTSLDLAQRYSELVTSCGDDHACLQVIDEVFGILNAPVSRALYADARTILKAVTLSIGQDNFTKISHAFWQKLWYYVNEAGKMPDGATIASMRQECEFCIGRTNRTTSVTQNSGRQNQARRLERCQGCGSVLSSSTKSLHHPEICVTCESRIREAAIAQARASQSDSSTSSASGCAGRIITTLLTAGFFALIAYLISRC